MGFDLFERLFAVAQVEVGGGVVQGLAEMLDGAVEGGLDGTLAQAGDDDEVLLADQLECGDDVLRVFAAQVGEQDD